MEITFRNQLRQILIAHEGIRYRPYLDAAGHLTIGIGHNLDVNPLSENVVYAINDEDINFFYAELSKELDFFNNLSDVRQMVLIDMAFNMGMKGFMEFDVFLEYMRDGEYDKAADDMMQTKWSSQVGKRAEDDANMLRYNLLSMP